MCQIYSVQYVYIPISNVDQIEMSCPNFILPVSVSPKWSISRQYELVWGPSSVIKVCNPFQNLSTDRHSVYSLYIEVQSKSLARLCDGFCLETCLNAVRLLRPCQSFCLDIEQIMVNGMEQNC